MYKTNILTPDLEGFCIGVPYFAGDNYLRGVFYYRGSFYSPGIFGASTGPKGKHSPSPGGETVNATTATTAPATTGCRSTHRPRPRPPGTGETAVRMAHEEPAANMQGNAPPPPVRVRLPLHRTAFFGNEGTVPPPKNFSPKSLRSDKDP